MAYTVEEYVDEIWAYSSRTVDAGTPAASDGSYIDDVGYAVWTYPSRTEDGGTGHSITGAGNISSSEAIGQPAITAVISDQNITGAGNISSSEALGQPALSVSLDLAGIASGEEFGQPTITVVAGAHDITDAGGIASGEEIGQPELSVTISATGIASGQAFGSPVVSVSIDLTSVGSSEAFGEPVIGLSVSLQGIESSEAFGQPYVGEVVKERFQGTSELSEMALSGSSSVTSTLAGSSALSPQDTFQSSCVVVYISESGCAMQESFGGSSELNTDHSFDGGSDIELSVEEERGIEWLFTSTSPLK